MKQLAWHHVLIVSIAILVLFTNLGTAKLWDRDEPRNAGCAWEMMMRGDWIVPIFNDEMRGAKPVLLYWLIMSAYAVFGVNEFAARFWSAMLAVGTVIGTYHIGRRLFSANVGLWAALILATTLMFDVAGRAATPDSLLIFCGTMALLIYVLGTFKPSAASSSRPLAPQLQIEGHYFPRRWPIVALMYGFMGLGILAKGPVGLVLPTAVIGMFLLIVRLQSGEQADTSDESGRPENVRWSTPQWCGLLAAISILLVVATIWKLFGVLMFALILASYSLVIGRTGWLSVFRTLHPLHFLRTCWYMRPITAIAVATAIALPWFIWVGLRTEGDFLHSFFVKEHFGRATIAMENHDGPPYFYLLAILVGFFPWSVFIGPTLIGAVRRLRRRDPWSVGYILAFCWAGVYIGIFTLATTKLPSYVTPCYPAIALLTGCFIDHWTRGTSLAPHIWPKLSMASLAIVGVTMLIALPIVAREVLPGEEWLGGIGVILLLGAGGCIWFISRNQLNRAGQTFALTAIAFTTVAFGFVTTQVSAHQQSQVLFRAINEGSVNPTIGSYGCLESTWVFYTKRPVLELDAAPALPQAIQLNTFSKRSKNWKPKPRVDIPTFFAQNPESFVITTRTHLVGLESNLPLDVKVVAETKYFLKKKENLVLLGRTNAPRIAQQRKSLRSRSFVK